MPLPDTLTGRPPPDRLTSHDSSRHTYQPYLLQSYQSCLPHADLQPYLIQTDLPSMTPPPIHTYKPGLPQTDLPAMPPPDRLKSPASPKRLTSYDSPIHLPVIPPTGRLTSHASSRQTQKPCIPKEIYQL